MKRYISTIYLSVCALALFGQDAPRWIDRAAREQLYPSSTFLTGFVSETVRPSDDVAQTRERLKREAQKQLSESIRLRIEGSTQASDRSVRVNEKEQIVSTYDAVTRTSSDVEIAGVTADAYFDSRKKVVYAFAYANRHEVVGYYKASVGTLVQQAESLLRTAGELEQSGEKAKARRQCEAIAPLLGKARAACDLLTAVSPSGSGGQQQAQLEALHNRSTQLAARLAQGVYVYMEGRENLFGAGVNIAVDKVKAALSLKGCSFTEEAAQADFRLRLNISTRQTGGSSCIVFCYADAVVELYDMRKRKAVYSDNLSQKGGSTSWDKAGRKALSDIAPKIAEKVSPWVE
ncbi:MAG: hypothetical protein LBH84_08960 [Prevotellaceae bacterium]|jgi:hypothetical protein|nr:hypothetical protein [Prevotellaceae bacterium]